MIKRKIYKKILEWKNQTHGTKALLIEGARRIGKSTVAEEIGRNEYKSYIIIDFNKASKRIQELFEDMNNLDIFFQTLSLEYNKRLYERESLIIFDEIQKFPKAREAITTSLGRFKEKFGRRIDMQVIIHPKNLAVDGEILKIPPYMFGAVYK